MALTHINRYGYCEDCHVPLEPVWFIEEEVKTERCNGTIISYKTGRKRRAVDYLLCEYCGKRECVDDSYDGDWYR